MKCFLIVGIIIYHPKRDYIGVSSYAWSFQVAMVKTCAQVSGGRHGVWRGHYGVAWAVGC